VSAPIDLSHIPLPLREEALNEGLDPAVIAKHWLRYIAWHEAHHGSDDYRRRDWTRQLEFAKRDAAETVPTTAESRLADQRKDAKSRKKREDAEYDRTAVDFWAYARSQPALQTFVEAHPGLGPLELIRRYGEAKLAKDGACSCQLCRTVTVLDGGGFVVNRHELTDEEREARRQEQIQAAASFASGRNT
jgi:hypothetical protein